MATLKNRNRVLVGIWVCQSLVLLTATHAAGQDWKENLAFAESQHEIIMLLIEQKKYNEVLPELRKILNLKFPSEYERRVAKEVDMVSDELFHKHQTNLAIEVLDEGLRSVNNKQCKAKFYKRKAYIYKKQGKLSQAEEMFRKAIELESN